jgi:hypothetical protein
MLRIALALFISIQAVAQGAPQDEIKDALAHAEALYYGARFGESITLLTRVDDSLKTQPGRIDEKINAKLRLALAYIGLNDTVKAKSFLVELYMLDSNYTLDPQQFPPKVLTVASEAKAEQSKLECSAAQDDAQKYVESSKIAPLLDLMRSFKRKCSGLAAIERQAAEAFYRTGVAAYKGGEFSSALSNLEGVVTLSLESPEHDLAQQYIDLIHGKMQVNQDLLFLQWRRNFESRQLTAAASDYRQMVSSNNGRSTPGVAEATGEYRKALALLVDNWNKSCGGDGATMNGIRKQISELLPEPSFGADIRAQMTACVDSNKTGTADARTEGRDAGAAPDSCFEMQAQLALARLKTRVDPVISNDIRYYLKNSPQVTVRVKARINETGDVVAISMPDSNPILTSSIRNAVGQWKFMPARDSRGPRCVDTEIPIVIKLAP